MTLTRALRASLSDGAVCLRFFSRLPMGAPHADAAPFGRAIGVLPLACLLIGACGALPLAAATAAGLPPTMAATAGVAAGLLASGALHEDGLADTADGLGGGASRERKLAIMRDSRIGTYGVLAVALALVWRIAALASLLDRVSLPAAMAAMLAASAGSRALALVPLAWLPPARTDGLARGVGALEAPALTLCFALAALIGTALPRLAGFDLFHGMLACGLAVLAALGVTGLARRQIGGHTGDIAGACQQLGEAAYYGGLLLFPTAA